MRHIKVALYLPPVPEKLHLEIVRLLEESRIAKIPFEISYASVLHELTSAGTREVKHHGHLAKIVELCLVHLLSQNLV